MPGSSDSGQKGQEGTSVFLCESFGGGTTPVPSLLPACPPGAASTLGSVLGPAQPAVLVDGVAWRTEPTAHPHGLTVTELPSDDKRVLTKRAWMVGVTGQGWGVGRERTGEAAFPAVTRDPGSECLPGAPHPRALERADPGPSCESRAGRALLPYLKGGCVAPLGDGVIC